MITQTLAAVLVGLAVQAPEPPGPPEPTGSNFAEWREYIRPKASELSFEACEWKPSFWEAVVEAERIGKPILLWAMNGHPLACT